MLDWRIYSGDEEEGRAAAKETSNETIIHVLCRSSIPRRDCYGLDNSNYYPVPYPANGLHLPNTQPVLRIKETYNDYLVLLDCLHFATQSGIQVTGSTLHLTDPCNLLLLPCLPKLLSFTCNGNGLGNSQHPYVSQICP